MANIENFLIGMKVPLPEKNARARIAMILQDLVEKKQVTVTVKGSGNTPNRYRLLAGSMDSPGGSEAVRRVSAEPAPGLNLQH